MGGDLQLLVAFPDRPPVRLANLADIFEPDTLRRKTGRSRKKVASHNAAA